MVNEWREDRIPTILINPEEWEDGKSPPIVNLYIYERNAWDERRVKRIVEYKRTDEPVASD